jgi:hypothetical protein
VQFCIPVIELIFKITIPMLVIVNMGNLYKLDSSPALELGDFRKFLVLNMYGLLLRLSYYVREKVLACCMSVCGHELVPTTNESNIWSINPVVVFLF